MLKLNRLEERQNPSVVWSENGIVNVWDDIYRDAYKPFSDYSGPIETAHLEGVGTVAAAVNRVQLKSVNGQVLFDQHVFDGWNGGLNVAVTKDAVYVGAKNGGGPRVQKLDFDGNVLEDRFVFEDSFRGGVFVETYDGNVGIFAGKGGGPVGEINGSKFFFGDPNFRSVDLWTIAEFDNKPTVFLTTETSLAGFDLFGNQITAATTQVAYTSIGSGFYALLGRNGLVGSANDGFGLDDIDPVTGFVQAFFRDPNFAHVGSAEAVPERVGRSSLIPYSQEIVNSLPSSLEEPELSFPTQRRTDQLNLGYSVGGVRGTGSLTVPVTKNGQIYGLTNRHVIDGGPVFAPGLADYRTEQIGAVVEVSKFDGLVDASLFTSSKVINNKIVFAQLDRRKADFTNQNKLTNSDIHVREFDLTGVSTVNLGQRVWRSGRTLAYGTGVVTDTNWAGIVNYGNLGIEVAYSNQIEVNGFNRAIAAPGDSGSPLYVWENGFKIVGQLFAGGNFNGIATPIQKVFDRFGVSLA